MESDNQCRVHMAETILGLLKEIVSLTKATIVSTRAFLGLYYKIQAQARVFQGPTGLLRLNHNHIIISLTMDLELASTMVTTPDLQMLVRIVWDKQELILKLARHRI